MVVVGFAAAGSGVAIDAFDKGADVLILEKMPEGLEGGATGVSGGNLDVPASGVGWTADYQSQVVSSLGTASEEFINTHLEWVRKLPDWLTAMGVEMDSETMPGFVNTKGPVYLRTGHVLFAALKNAVNQRGIPVLYETPGKELIQDPVTKEILGVKAERQGTPVYVKARKGVALTCGGYESNLEMLNSFHHPAVEIMFEGSPANTGDGLRMAAKAGAHIHHLAMGLEWGNFCFKAPSKVYETAIVVGQGVGGTIDYYSYIFVDKLGERFMNERKEAMHLKEPLEVLDFKGGVFTPPNQVGYPHIPFFMVFDEKTRKTGPLAKVSGLPGSWGWNTGDPDRHQAYQWSQDNLAEIKEGWIVQADTLEELATKITGTDCWGNTTSIDPDGLVATVAKFNQFCEAGEDADFGRPKDTLLPLDTPPFYAAELCLTSLYTLGGPKKNAKAQVVDYDDNPIPRLYAAGDVSDHGIYKMGAMAGAMTWGRIAAHHLVAEEPWD